MSETDDNATAPIRYSYEFQHNRTTFSMNHNVSESIMPHFQNSASDYYMDPTKDQMELMNSNPVTSSLGYSESFNVVQETISPVKEQDWETVKREVQALKKEIQQKTMFYTSLKDKFLETEERWGQQRKGLLAQISLMRARKDSDYSNVKQDPEESLAILQQQLVQAQNKIAQLLSQPESISLQKAEICRLQQEVALREGAWSKERTILQQELSVLRIQIGKISFIHRKQEELQRHINHQSQQMSLMGRDIHQSRKREEIQVSNINRLTLEVERLSLVHEKTNAMQLELQKLNLELGRWYQRGDKTGREFPDAVAQEKVKCLQKRIYLLQAANFNLSEEIKRNREIRNSLSVLQQSLGSIKIQLVRQQIQKQNALKESQQLRQQLLIKKQKKDRPRRKKPIEQVKLKESPNPPSQFSGFQAKIQKLREETMELKRGFNRLD